MKRLVFSLIATGFTLAAFAQPQKVVADKVISIVGDRIILYSDVMNALADAARQNEGRLPPNAQCIIMEQALLSKIMMLQAEKDSLVVPEDEIEAELDNRVRYFIDIYGTQQAVEEIAGKTIYQIKDEARESVRENMMAREMQRNIVSNVRITPNEVRDFFNSIPKDSLPYFESELELGQIVLYPKASHEMEQYIIGELNNYRQQVLSGSTTFQQLARNFSEDPGSKERGGQYQINRNENRWDPAFLSASFRLKEGEISAPVKSQFGYHIIQMVQRSGDDAIIRHILRIPTVTEDEVALALDKLDTIRSKIIAGTLEFGEAGTRYSEDPSAKFLGPWIISRDGDPYSTIDELDKDMVVMLDDLKVGEYSKPVQYTDPSGKKAVRIVFLKSKSQPHIMNLTDDYDRIAKEALERKKARVLEEWIEDHITNYYIMVDEEVAGSCPNMSRFTADATASK